MRLFSNKVVISVSPGIIPVTVTNSQNIDAQAGTQVMAQLSSSNLQPIFRDVTTQIIKANFANLRFMYNGSFVPGWVEAISNGVATVWLKIPVSIPANSSIKLQLVYSPYNYDGRYWGIAPQLTSPYGEYDNGASVFNNYWNFAGTSLPSGWSAIGGFTSYKVNNGLTITGALNGVAGLESNIQLSPPYILETYADYPSESLSSWFNIFGVGTNGNQQLIQITTVYSIQSYNAGGSSVEIASSGLAVWSIIGIPPSTAYVSLNYGAQVSSSSTNPVTFPANIYSPSSGGFTGSLTNNITEYYIRTRAYPPNGVMPSITIGD